MYKKIKIIRNNRRKMIYISTIDSTQKETDTSVIKFDCKRLGIKYNKDEWKEETVYNNLEFAIRNEGLKYNDYKLLTWNNAKKQWFYEPKKN